MNSKNYISENEFVIKSSTDHLSEVRKFIKSTAKEYGMDKNNASKVVLAVDEACTNIIKHAYNYSPSGTITIKTKLYKTKMSVTISDKGTHFNPNSVPEPDIAGSQKQKKRGGLGIFIMKKLMDDVQFKLTGNGNEVILVKYLT